MLKTAVKTILSFVLMAVFLISACGSIEGPEIWIYASVICLALITYSVVGIYIDRRNNAGEGDDRTK